jgi:hypothetical protein
LLFDVEDIRITFLENVGELLPEICRVTFQKIIVFHPI